MASQEAEIPFDDKLVETLLRTYTKPEKGAPAEMPDLFGLD